MAFMAPLRQSLVPLLLVCALAACSTDTLDIDSGTRVSAIRPQRQQQVLPVAESQAAYPVDGQAAGALDQTMEPRSMAQPRNLPMIDSDEAAGVQPLGTEPALGAPPRILGQLHSDPRMQGQTAQPSMADPMLQGVSMDDQLGLGQGQAAPQQGRSLAEEEAVQIAETNPQEPVIGGIGTDNPVAYPSARRAAEAPDSVDPLLAEQQDFPETAPAPVRQSYPPSQQVAMLPRPIDPLANPVLAPRPAAMPASEQACRSALQKLGVRFQNVTPISNGPTCGIPYPIKVSGFAGQIGMKPAITLNCQVTLAFAQWVKNELNPSARYRYWSGVRTIIPLGGYSCRRMNSSRRNPWSEHARGNAIDVGKFILNNGKEIDVRKPGFFAFREKGLLNAVRSDSCKYFHTVLGPGSDPHHKDHFHFDLRARKSGYRHCD